MKKQTKCLTIAAALAAASLHAQITVTSLSAGDFFYDLTAAMNSELPTLFQNAPGTYGSFVYTFSPGFASGAFVTDPDTTFDSPYTELGVSLVFERQPASIDHRGFIFSGDAFVGYIGNESVDRNKFGFQQLDIATMLPTSTNEVLYHYQSAMLGPDVPPQADVLSVPEGMEVAVRFFHENRGLLDYQNDDARFHIYRASLSEEFGIGNLWMFAIDDREVELIDFDDGFFIFGGDRVTPVPEPATIGLVGIGAVLALVMVRRARRVKVCG